jgi:hypothetical protein
MPSGVTRTTTPGSNGTEPYYQPYACGYGGGPSYGGGPYYYGAPRYYARPYKHWTEF